MIFSNFKDQTLNYEHDARFIYLLVFIYFFTLNKSFNIYFPSHELIKKYPNWELCCWTDHKK